LNAAQDFKPDRPAHAFVLREEPVSYRVKKTK
jgi:hypothetical protein